MNFPYHLPAGGFGLDEGGHQVIVSQGEENPERGPSQEERQHCTDLSLYCDLCFIFIFYFYKIQTTQHTTASFWNIPYYLFLLYFFAQNREHSQGFCHRHLKLSKLRGDFFPIFSFHCIFLVHFSTFSYSSSTFKKSLFSEYSFMSFVLLFCLNY